MGTPSLPSVIYDFCVFCFFGVYGVVTWGRVVRSHHRSGTKLLYTNTKNTRNTKNTKNAKNTKNMYVCMCVCVYVRMCVHVCVCVCMCVVPPALGSVLKSVCV